MKRLGLILLLVVLVGCSSAPKRQAGTYEATGQGYNTEAGVRLSVSIDESGKIVEVRILEQHETDDIGGKALEKLADEAVAKNTADVDTVSGATRTSEGFRDALNAALKQAENAEGSAS